MNKLISTISFLLASVILRAQGPSDSLSSSETEVSEWSDQTWTWLLGVFIVVSIIAVLRTFRNKAEV